MKKVRTKLLLNFVLILLLLAVIGGISVVNIHKANETVDEMLSNDFQFLIASEKLSYNLAERVAAARGYLLFGSIDYKYQYYGYSAASEKLEEQILSEKNIDEAVTELITKSREWTTLIDEQVFPAIDSGDEETALVLLQQTAEPQAQELMDGFKDLSEVRETHMVTVGENIIQDNNLVEKTIFITAVASLIIGIIIAIIAARMIVTPITLVVQRMMRIAEGDLSGEHLQTKLKDELGALMTTCNDMVDSLRRLVTNVNQSSEHVASSAEELTASAEQTSNATEQIAATSEQMAAGAEAQLESVNEAAVTINQISAGIQQIAANSETVSTLAGEASISCHDGVNTVNEVVDQMNAIENTVKDSATVIETLGERSNEIDDIVTMITDISDQTSLLALNAAIEAARAGDAGRGFAVVADEVRKLAEQSADSALQITGLVRTIQEETTVAVQSMEEGTEKTTDGLLKTNALRNVFEKIEQAVQDVEAKVQEVSAAAEQIASGSNQMVEGVNVVKEAAETNTHASQENAAASEEQLAMMEEISASAQALTKLADEMSDMVGTFKL